MSNKKVKIKPVITYSELRLLVERYVITDKMSYTEAVIEVCNERNIEIEDIGRIIRGPLKAKLEAEAMSKNIIKRTTTYLM